MFLLIIHNVFPIKPGSGVFSGLCNSCIDVYDLNMIQLISIQNSFIFDPLNNPGSADENLCPE